MCCTFYLKSSLYNLITALKRGTQYSCFPQQVGVLCSLLLCIPSPGHGCDVWGGGRMLGNTEARLVGEKPGGSSEGGIPKGRASSGIEEIRILSISDSWSRLVLARRF